MKNTERKASPCIIGGVGSVIKSLSHAREALPNKAIQNLGLSEFIFKILCIFIITRTSRVFREVLQTANK